MKEGIHPDYHPVVFVDGSADFELVTRSTKTSDETRDIDGVEHFVLRVEISSASHQFFTGQQRFIDTAGRVEKFQRRYEKFYKKDEPETPEAAAKPEAEPEKVEAKAKKPAAKKSKAKKPAAKEPEAEKLEAKAKKPAAKKSKAKKPAAKEPEAEAESSDES